MENVPPHIDAIFKEYIGSRNLAIADLQVYAKAPVGVGEHPDIGAMIKKKIAEIDQYESLLQTLMNLYPVLNASVEKNPEPESPPIEDTGVKTDLYEDGKLISKFKNQNSD